MPDSKVQVAPSGHRGFRRARFGIVLDQIDRVLSEKDSCRILDVGGTPEYWENVSDLIGSRSINVDILNLTAAQTSNPNYRIIVGDACNLLELEGNKYDIAHSNSVIEHVGDWANMCAMAEGIAAVAPRYFVQVPYFWFPFEPHWRVPFLHWFSDPIRAKMIRAFGLGSPPGQTMHVAMKRAQGARILDKEQLAALFPDGRILEEKLSGVLTKSLMVVRP